MQYLDETTSSVRRQLRRADRFDNYSESSARVDSTGNCGHAITKGQVIGYNRTHGCKCAACWAKWSQENVEADMDERMMSGGY